MIPTFAVVGHPNKGKSSIVATLAEDEEIIIGALPGTTRAAQRHTFSIDGEPQYVLVDTPGFQRARAVLDWFEAQDAAANERPRVVADFVAVHADDPRFRDECELLRPIVEGAGILYVVDGAKPYGPEYEVEMEVLQWTGQPRMALINLIGAGDHTAQWRRALDQYFSIVRVFDAVHADFAKRLSLLRAFAELDESWRAALVRSVEALQEDRRRRVQRAAHAIADCLVDCLTWAEEADLSPSATDAEREALVQRLTDLLGDRIRGREAECREIVQSIYRHRALGRKEEARLLAADLFTTENWELFGLSRSELVVTGAVSGAVAGAGFDVLLGGASLLAGAGVGALIGAAGALFGSEQLARVRVLGQSLGGKVVRVGPVRAGNFPWVVLGRAWVHHQLVAERNHALREAVSVSIAEQSHLMDVLPAELRSGLAKLMQRIRDGEADVAMRHNAAALIGEMLEFEHPSSVG